MSEINLTLPDGSVRVHPKGSTAFDLATDIGPGLTKASIAITVNDVQKALHDPVDEDTENDIRDFAKKLEIPHEFFYRDSFGSVSKKFFRGKFAFPTIVGVSKRKLIFRHSGIDEKIKEDIQEKLMNQG